MSFFRLHLFGCLIICLLVRARKVLLPFSVSLSFALLIAFCNSFKEDNFLLFVCIFNTVIFVLGFVIIEPTHFPLF